MLKDLKITRRVSGPDFGVEDIKSLESDLGMTFPDGYRDFLLTYQGAGPSPGEFYVMDGDAEGAHILSGSMIHYFLTLEDKSCIYSIRSTIEFFMDELPENHLPIAVDPFGNYVILSFDSSAFGRVYFWDHEYYTGDEEDEDRMTLFPINATFDGFINSLFGDD